MKRCPKCDTEKELTEFNKDSSTTSGIATWCRECCRAKNRDQYRKNREKRLKYAKENYDPETAKIKNRAWYLANREKAIEDAKKWASENREKRREYGREAYKRDPEKYLERQRRYAAEHPEIFRAKASLRRSRVKRATPPWVDLEEIGAFYEEARTLTEITGEQHQVGHIVPLVHSDICGLHVPWNLQVLTQTENGSKGNKLEEEMA